MSGILIIAERALPDRGGLAVATSRIAGHAADGGETVHVLHLSKSVAPGGLSVATRGAVTFHTLGLLQDNDESTMALHYHAFRIARAHGLDVMHGIYATRAGYVATLAAAQLGCASVVSIRGNDLDRGAFRPQTLPLLQHALGHAHVVTAVSSPLASLAQALSGRDVRHITNAVDAHAFKPERPDPSVRAAMGIVDRQVIGFSGELREKKGMRFLLPAFAALVGKRPVSLLLLGSIRADSLDAWEAFKRVQPEASRHVHGIPYERNHRRLRDLLSLCDVVVSPSLYDGTPNAVLEAMACARPVLATAVGGHLDLIVHGESGALLDLEDLDKLPDALEEMLDLGPAERDQMGQKARARVLARHSMSIERDAYRDAYRDARDAAGAGRLATSLARSSVPLTTTS